MHNFPTSIFPSFTSHIFSPCSTRRLLNLAGNFGFSSKTVNFEGCFFKSLNGCFVSRHNPRAKLHRLKWTSLKKKPRTIFTFLSRWFCLRRRKSTLCNSGCEVYLNCLYKRASLKACSLRMENGYNFLPIFLSRSHWILSGKRSSISVPALLMLLCQFYWQRNVMQPPPKNTPIKKRIYRNRSLSRNEKKGWTTKKK